MMYCINGNKYKPSKTTIVSHSKNTQFQDVIEIVFEYKMAIQALVLSSVSFIIFSTREITLKMRSSE